MRGERENFIKQLTSAVKLPRKLKLWKCDTVESPHLDSLYLYYIYEYVIIVYSRMLFSGCLLYDSYYARKWGNHGEIIDGLLYSKNEQFMNFLLA